MTADIPEHIKSLFNRDESVNEIVGEVPHRAVYAKLAKEPLTTGEITSGTHVAEGISAFWDDKDVTVDFQLEDNSLSFSFSRVMNGYFSISWSLNSAEIEKLTSNQILSLHIDDIVNSAGNSVRANLGSRMTYIKGRDERQVSLNVANIQNRIVTAAALQDDSTNFSSLYRIWIDLIVTGARSKTLIFKRPMLIIQEQLLL